MPICRGDGNSSLTAREARLLGYYVAEGSVFRNTSSGVCFTCNRQDELVREIKGLAGDVTVCFNKHSNSAEAYNVQVYDAALADLAEQEVGRGVRNKAIPAAVYNAPRDVKLEFLAAWFNGDGWQDVKGLHWSTCSRPLSLELQMLLASLDLPASVYRIDHTSGLPHGVPRSGDGIEYTVNVSNRHSGLFAGRSKAKTVRMSKPTSFVFITGDYLAVPLERVEYVEEETEVYDLSVEEDESFTAFGLAVHNCKVPFDICSVCNNRAKNRSEYCTSEKEGGHCKGGGLKSNIAGVLEDGTQVYADNPDPLWFDDSWVWRHADRIAGATGIVKAAAAGGVALGGAALAEAWGVTMPWRVALDGADGAVKLAGTLAEWEARYRREPPRDTLGLAFRKAADECSWADHETSRADALAGLAARRVVAPVEGFLELMGGTKAAAEQVRRRLPGVYGRMLADGSLQKAAEDGAFLAQRVPSLKARRWAEKRARFGSLDRGDVARRATLALVRGEATPPLAPEPEGDGGAAEKLARAYALYKLAVLHSQPRDQGFGWACMATARGNYY
jgi:hypothetical protein